MSEKLTIEHVFGTIVPSWTRIVFHNSENERIALARGEVCRTCPNLNHIVSSKKWGKKCGLCGCPIIGLVRSVDKHECEANKWGE